MFQIYFLDTVVVILTKLLDRLVDTILDLLVVYVYLDDGLS